MSKTKIRVAIADDHQMVLDGLEMIISQEPVLELVGAVHNGQEAIDLLSEKEVEVLLLDVNMPVMNGIEAMKIIGNRFPKTRVLGLSMLDDTVVVKQLLKYGAQGFLLKNAGKERIIQAISDLHKGQKYFDKAIVDQLLGSETKRSVGTSLFPKLSRREKEILLLVIKEYTTKEIAQQLNISFGTVETHRRNTINKLGVRNTAGLVRVALEYQLLEE